MNVLIACLIQPLAAKLQQTYKCDMCVYVHELCYK